MKKSIKHIKSQPGAMSRIARLWAGSANLENGTLARILGEWRKDRIRLVLDKNLYYEAIKRG